MPGQAGIARQSMPALPTSASAKQNSSVDWALVREDGLYFSGRFAGGIRADIRRRLPWYASDWTDGARGGVKTLTAALYMFFGCLAPGIAFGAYFDQYSGGKSGVVEYLITQGVSGVIFAIISGQPLVILRPTGPITVFISQLYRITAPMGVDYLSVQAWVGIFTGLYMIIIAVTDLFGFFVSIIFISMGIGNIVDKFTVKSETYHAPVQLIITVAMLYTAVTLAGFSKARFFNSKVRELVADFAVALSVVIFTAIANLVTVPLEPLPVPAQFAPTDTTRSWFVNLGCPACAGIGLVAAIPLVMLFVVDQNVTSLLTQHADHNLKKGAAFHYNFLILGVFNVCFPLFGCPFVTGSLPHSPQFVHALARKEVIREGGVDRTRIVEVYENRVAPLLVNVLILVSLPVIGKLRYIPTAVICDALFLFMGLSGLPGNQLFERLKLIFTEEALYPPLRFTKEDVPRKQMHLFTAFQLMVVGVLFAVTRSPVAVAFPIFLVSSIFLRMKLPWITCGFITKEMVDILDDTAKAKTPATVEEGDFEEERQQESHEVKQVVHVEDLP